MILNTIALVSAFAGTVLVFFCGLPPGILREGQYVGEADDAEAKITALEIWSYVGLGMIALGFLLQLVAIWT